MKHAGILVPCSMNTVTTIEALTKRSYRWKQFGTSSLEFRVMALPNQTIILAFEDRRTWMLQCPADVYGAFEAGDQLWSHDHQRDPSDPLPLLDVWIANRPSPVWRLVETTPGARGAEIMHARWLDAEARLAKARARLRAVEALEALPMTAEVVRTAHELALVGRA